MKPHMVFWLKRASTCDLKPGACLDTFHSLVLLAIYFPPTSSENDFHSCGFASSGSCINHIFGALPALWNPPSTCQFTKPTWRIFSLLGAPCPQLILVAHTTSLRDRCLITALPPIWLQRLLEETRRFTTFTTTSPISKTRMSDADLPLRRSIRRLLGGTMFELLLSRV